MSRRRTARLRQPRQRSQRSQRGSLLVLVVVSLVMLVVLGTSYMQVARVDRVATRQVATTYIDQVKAAAIAEIARILKEDIVDQQGRFLSGADTGIGDVDEPHDTPYTGTDDWPGRGINGNLVAKGNRFDDTWLAATTTEGGIWLHLTNLRGVFLRAMSGNPSDLRTAAAPTEDLVHNLGADPWNYDSGLDLNDAAHAALLVDASGNGVPDSRWTWAPDGFVQIGGNTYVMAVKILDSSSLLNIGVATAMTDDGGNNWATNLDRPRGYYPTSVDMTRMIARAPGLVGEAWVLLQQARSLFGGLPTPLAGAGGRSDAWFSFASMYGHTSNLLSFENEVELRLRGGLNRPDVTTTAEMWMRGTLRTLDVESSWSDVAGVTTMQEYMEGTAGPISGRALPAVRHLMTSFSGHAALAPNHVGIRSQDFDADPASYDPLKYDLLTQDAGDPAVRQASIAELLRRIFTVGTEGSTTYLGLNDDELEIVANEYAVAIMDYMDADSTPTSWEDTVNNRTHYGLEVLPFLREIYLQAGYVDSDNDDPNQPGPHPNGAQDGLSDTWVYKPDSAVVAVEIGNPFDRAILESTFDDVKIVVVQNGSSVSEYELGALGDFEDRITSLATSQGRLVVYSDPASSADEGGSGGDLATDLGLPGDAHKTSTDGTLSFNPDGNDVMVELQVDVDPGASRDWVTYDRLTVANLNLPTEIVHNSARVAPGAEAHGQGSAVRAVGPFGIRYLSNQDKALVVDPMRQPSPPGGNSYRTDADRLGQDLKGPTGDAAFDSFQIPVANRSVFSVAELGWIHMFGFHDGPNGDLPARLSGPGGNTGLDAKRRFLDLHPPSDASPAVRAAISGRAQPLAHAAMVMDQFTTLSPRHDGQDNDADDAANPDEPDERFIPGTININTAPLTVATLAAPIPEPIDDVEALMSAIATYRDTHGGIASIGELLFVEGGTPAEDIQRYASAALPGNHDLYPLPEGGFAAIPGNVNESRLARFQFLSQAFTTRSDVFVAYVKIAGYPTSDFSLGAVESAHFFVIFDRSAIVDGVTDQVRVIGPYDMK